MSLQDFINSIIFDTTQLNPSQAAVYEQSVIDVISEVYQGVGTTHTGSQIARNMFDSLVTSGRTITIAYSPGVMRWDVDASMASNEVVLFDFSAPQDIILIDNDGSLFEATPRRMLTHELTHAIENWFDNPRGGLPTSPNFDFTGPVVERTNEIEQELGSANDRVSYWGNFSASFPEDYARFGSSLTEGAPVDIAYTATPRKDFSFVDTSTQQTATNDLLVGLGSDNTFVTGAGNDWIYGGNGNNILDGGADDDHIFGDGGFDIISGGTGVDELNGGADNDIITDAGDVDGDILRGGSGNDELTIEGTGQGELHGGTGSDILYGNGYSVLSAGADADADVVMALTGDTIMGRLTHEDALFMGLLR